MLRTILENQRVILEALRDGTDTEWITSEIDKRIEATSEELSKLHQPIAISTACDCENKVYDPLMSGEVKCLRCGKMIAQTDL